MDGYNTSMGRDMLMYVVNNEASSMFGQIPLKL
jgi:hypothetical protein